MILGMQRLTSFLIVMLMWTGLPGCGGGDGGPNAPAEGPPQVAPQVSVAPPQNLGAVTLQPGDSSDEVFVDVGGSSFMLVANGGNARDIDIHSVVDPSGTTLVTADRQDDDPIGGNRLNIAGGSAVAGLFPHTPAYSIQPGRYSFRVRNAGGFKTTINVSAIVKNGVNSSSGTLNVNLVFCGVPGLSASNALLGEVLSSQKFLAGFNEFKRIFREAAHIEIAVLGRSDCSFAAQASVGFLGGDDFDLNGQADELDRLFALHKQDMIGLGLSSNLPENALTFYIIPTIEPGLFEPSFGTTLGVSGGIPGPGFTPGTRHSGVAVSTLGAPALLPDELAKGLGRTMAHEAAHFLGLFHTTESDGLHDPISDTLDCPVGNNANGNDRLEFPECSSFDGDNLMFWDGRSSGIQLTDGQRLVLHRNPLIH